MRSRAGLDPELESKISIHCGQGKSNSGKILGGFGWLIVCLVAYLVSSSFSLKKILAATFCYMPAFSRTPYCNRKKTVSYTYYMTYMCICIMSYRYIDSYPSIYLYYVSFYICLGFFVFVFLKWTQEKGKGKTLGLQGDKTQWFTYPNTKSSFVFFSLLLLLLF